MIFKYYIILEFFLMIRVLLLLLEGNRHMNIILLAFNNLKITQT